MTKLISPLVAALIVVAGAASADHLLIPHVQKPDTHLVLGTITLDTDGGVEVYDYHLGQQGELLGSQPLTAGANSDVVVQLPAAPQYPVLVVLKEGDETVDTTVVRFNDDEE